MTTIITNKPPVLSVLLTAGNRRERVANALASVLKQSLVDQIEVIVLECGDPDPDPVPGQDNPYVRTVCFPRGTGAGRVRAEAVRMAHAPIVVFLEEHAEAGPGWVEAILSAFDEDTWVAVGPEISNGNVSIRLTDAIALCYYPLSESPAKRQEAQSLPFHNSAYRREIILQYDRDLERLFAPEILLQWRLCADGFRLLLEPACKVQHHYETEISTIWLLEANVQRAFIVNWADLYRWPPWKRIVRAMCAPLIPFIRSSKLLLLLARYRPDQLSRYFKRVHLMVASSYIACVVGELRG